MLERVMHSSDVGALLLMAHPAKNISRVEEKEHLIKSLIARGIDGFCVKEFDDKTINFMIQTIAHYDNIAVNPLIMDAGGCDCRSIVDYENNHVMKFNTYTSARFVSELELLNRARLAGLSSHRTYAQRDLFNVEKFVLENEYKSE